MNDDFRATLNSFGLEEIRRWVYDRLHGRDVLCPPPDPRDDERLYVRVSQLHGSARMSDQFKLHVRTAVCDALRDAARHYPAGEWTDPEALDSLLLLAVDVGEGLVRSSLKDDLAQSHWELVTKLPFEDDGIPLKRFAAMALLEARTPPPEPEVFWKELWSVAAADGWTGFAGVVFEGLWRHVGLESAAQWFATAEPWDEEVMPGVLDDKLAGIIAESNMERVTMEMETCLLPRLLDLVRRNTVWDVCRKHGLAPWLSLEAEEFVLNHFAEVILKVSGAGCSSKQSAPEIARAPGMIVKCLQQLPTLLDADDGELSLDELSKAYRVANRLSADDRISETAAIFWTEFRAIVRWDIVAKTVQEKLGARLYPHLYPHSPSVSVQLSL